MVTYLLLTVFSRCSMASYSPTILSEGLLPLGRDFWLSPVSQPACDTGDIAIEQPEVLFCTYTIV